MKSRRAGTGALVLALAALIVGSAVAGLSSYYFDTATGSSAHNTTGYTITFNAVDTSSNNSALAGVLVTIAGMNGTTASDGVVAISGIHAGTHDLVASKAGYNSFTDAIPVAADANQAILMVATPASPSATLTASVPNVNFLSFSSISDDNGVQTLAAGSAPIGAASHPTWGDPLGVILTATTVSCTLASLAVGVNSSCTASINGAIFGSISGETITFTQAGGTGSVSFPSGATCNLLGISCSVTVSGRSSGPVTIHASYPGNAMISGSTGNASLMVTQSVTVTSSCTAYLAVGATLPCTASVTGATGSVSGETITFTQAGGTGSVSFPSQATCNLSGISCQIAVTGASPGAATVQASYGGDANNSAGSGAATIAVIAPTTTTAAAVMSSSTSTVTTTSHMSGATQTSSGASAPPFPLYSLALLAAAAVLAAVGLRGQSVTASRRASRAQPNPS
jgi:hypothetical protein